MLGLAKKGFGLPISTANTFAHAPKDEGGLGCPSLRAAVAYAAARNFRRSIDSPGQLGTWARALLTYQLQLVKAGKQVGDIFRYSMRLRQLAAINDAGLDMGWESQADPAKQELAELLTWWQTIQPHKPADSTAMLWAQVQDGMQGDLAPLFKAGVCDTRTLFDSTAQAVRSLDEMGRTRGFRADRKSATAPWRLCVRLTTGQRPPRSPPPSVKQCRWQPPVAERKVKAELWEALEAALQLSPGRLGDLRGNSVLDQLQRAPLVDPEQPALALTVGANAGDRL